MPEEEQDQNIISDMPIVGGERQRLQATEAELLELKQQKKEEDELNKADLDPRLEHVGEEQQHNVGVPNEDVAREQEQVAKQQREIQEASSIREIPKRIVSKSRQFREIVSQAREDVLDELSGRHRRKKPQYY